ncbi:MAG TPA: polysaccharide deacetylase family protein [Clostridia bacterium]
MKKDNIGLMSLIFATCLIIVMASFIFISRKDNTNETSQTSVVMQQKPLTPKQNVINKHSAKKDPIKPAANGGVVPKKQVEKKKEIDNRFYIPILCYHCVSDKMWGDEVLFVSPKDFDEEMNYLKKNNYNAITFNELPNAKKIKNPVLITFDDGYENNYTEAYPILKKYGFRATEFMVSNFINGGSMLKDSELKAMSDIFDIQSHTVTHPNLSLLSTEQIETELSESKKALEKLTGKKVFALAYPIGIFNDESVRIAKKYYSYAVLADGGRCNLDGNKYLMRRINVPRGTTIETFEKKMKGIRR